MWPPTRMRRLTWPRNGRMWWSSCCSAWLTTTAPPCPLSTPRVTPGATPSCTMAFGGRGSHRVFRLERGVLAVSVMLPSAPLHPPPPSHHFDTLLTFTSDNQPTPANLTPSAQKHTKTTPHTDTFAHTYTGSKEPNLEMDSTNFWCKCILMSSKIDTVLSTHIDMHTQAHTHARMHVCTHTYTHTHMHTHTHTHMDQRTDFQIYITHF